MNFYSDCFLIMDVMLKTHLLASLQLNGLTSLKKNNLSFSTRFWENAVGSFQK